MERILEKMVRQLNAYDEASLMSLWDKYAGIVANFEPTKRWEEAALIFGVIQAVRWKNGLFNYHWAQSARPDEDDRPLAGPGFSLGFQSPQPASAHDAGPDQQPNSGNVGPSTRNGGKEGGKVLRFRPRKGDESV